MSYDFIENVQPGDWYILFDYQNNVYEMTS